MVRCAARVAGCDLSYPGIDEGVTRWDEGAWKLLYLDRLGRSLGVIYNSVIEELFNILL